MALTVDEVKSETAKDATRQTVIRLVQTNKCMALHIREALK